MEFYESDSDSSDGRIPNADGYIIYCAVCDIRFRKVKYLKKHIKRRIHKKNYQLLTLKPNKDDWDIQVLKDWENE